jgi:8-oxo-dGTP diphosphatase
MRLYLVRHAKAGNRSQWVGDDTVRPLSEAGWLQAHSIAQRLAMRRPTVLLSSPYVRCVQTLEPLADELGLDVQLDKRLAEGGEFEAVLDLFASVPDATVMCSHGDVIPETIAALVRRGCRITTPPDWRKASIWRIERDDHGEFIAAKVWAPPS